MVADGTDASPITGGRLALGVALFGLGFGAPAFIPLVARSELPGIWKTVLSGLLALGVPEILMLAAAAVMGRAGFAELKRRLLRLLRRHGPPDRVSPARYRVGLVMFATPLLIGWLGPYLQHSFPGPVSGLLWLAVLGDVTFLVSFFVLGGDFWDKIRSLFVHGARAVLPSHGGSPSGDLG